MRERGKKNALDLKMGGLKSQMEILLPPDSDSNLFVYWSKKHKPFSYKKAKSWGVLVLKP